MKILQDVSQVVSVHVQIHADNVNVNAQWMLLSTCCDFLFHNCNAKLKSSRNSVL